MKRNRISGPLSYGCSKQRTVSVAVVKQMSHKDERGIPMELTVGAAVILSMLLSSFTGDNSFATAQTGHRAHTTRKKRTATTKKSSPYDGVPLKQAKDKKQILFYYRQTALSPVHTHDFRLDGKSIFCLSFDSGSGACIEWGYEVTNGSWHTSSCLHSTRFQTNP